MRDRQTDGRQEVGMPQHTTAHDTARRACWRPRTCGPDCHVVNHAVPVDVGVQLCWGEVQLAQRAACGSIGSSGSDNSSGSVFRRQSVALPLQGGECGCVDLDAAVTAAGMSCSRSKLCPFVTAGVAHPLTHPQTPLPPPEVTTPTTQRQAPPPHLSKRG